MQGRVLIRSLEEVRLDRVNVREKSDWCERLVGNMGGWILMDLQG